MRLKRLCIFNLIIISIFSFLLTQNLNADPLPVKIIEVKEGGNPIPDSETPLIFKSEDLIFQINKEVLITANFTIFNPTNLTINQSIIFPFYTYSYTIGTHDVPGFYAYSIINLSIFQNGSKIPYKNESYNDNPAISFKISVPPYNEQTIFLKYNTHYGLLEDDVCILKYIATTGKEWNNTINYAYFEFKFINSSIIGNPSGGDNIIKENGYLKTTIERHNWIPNEDISIIWTLNKSQPNDNNLNDLDIDDEKEDKKNGELFIPSFNIMVIICAFGISMVIFWFKEKHSFE